MGTKSYDAGGCDSFVDVNAQWTMSSLGPPAWRGGCWSRGEWGSVNWIINASTARLITTVSSVSQPGPNRKETDNNRPAGMYVPCTECRPLIPPSRHWLTDQLMPPTLLCQSRRQLTCPPSLHLLNTVVIRFNRIHSIESPITNKIFRTPNSKTRSLTVIRCSKFCLLNQFRLQTSGLFNYVLQSALNISSTLYGRAK